MSGTIINDNPPNDGREWECQCARCGSSIDWRRCEICDDGFDGHDCGEDCCCCAHPEPNVACDVCGGKGGWWECASVYSGWCDEHPRNGREATKPSTPEWYTLDTEGSER
jgi:hypothetical protein